MAGSWIRFLFWGLNQTVLGCNALFLQLSAQKRRVRWSWVGFHRSQATACMRKIDEVICIKVQCWDTMFCFSQCTCKNTVKAKVTLHIKASDSILPEFHGSRTLFTSTPYLTVWFVRGEPVGWWFSIDFLLLVQLHLGKMFGSLSELQLL